MPLDYLAWCERLRTFLKQAARLPGAVSVSDSIQRPEDENDYPTSLAEVHSSLPPEVFGFLRNASARCAFDYDWMPTAGWRERFSEFYPQLDSIRGGADLCEMAAYSNYANRDLIANLIPFGSWYKPDPPLYDGFVRLTSPRHGSTEREVALKCEDGADRGVYLVDPQNKSDKQRISMTFDEFLSDWETIRYVELSLDHLQPWLDGDSGLLRPDADKAARWQALFDEAAA